jgi:hypothetical protein
MAVPNQRGFRFEEFTGLTVRAALLLAVPAAALVIGAFWVTAHFLEPMPPRRVVFAAGPQGGSASALAERYARILADDGIAVEVRHTEGAGENVGLLADRGSGVDIAFVLAGTVEPPLAGKIVSVSNIMIAPLWGVSRGPHRIEDSLSGARESVLQAAGLYTLRAHLHVVRATVVARARARQAAAGAAPT